MPELPEVETIVRELHKAVRGKTVRRFSVYDTKRIKAPKVALPQKILVVSRHGKFIVLNTSAGYCLIHLRMTGELLFQPFVPAKAGTYVENKLSDHKHERVVFHFTDGSLLRFLDIRRFGTIEWRKAGEPLPQLGIDPLSKNFSPQALLDLSRGSRRPIKSFLLDQQKIAGIGNIYADEALWHAKINPRRPAGALLPAAAARLVAAIKRVLLEGIEKGGFTLRDYRRIDGSFGYYQKSRKVYGREGEKCLPRAGSRGPRCGTKIKRIKIGGRSSYFCPACQK